MASTDSKSIAVLGGGLTGLAAAHRLVSLGHRVRLFEQERRVGGVIRSESREGWLIESGPHSLQETTSEISALIAAAGLQDERIEADAQARNRFLVRRGTLVPLPLSPPAFLRSSLLSPAAKGRVLAELLSSRKSRAADLSVADFMRAHFGAEAVERIVQPFVSGIYAGDPAKLSARHAFPRFWEMERQEGSLLRAQVALARKRRAAGATATPGIVSFRRGLQMLPDALAAGLPPDTIRTGARVEALVAGAHWEVRSAEGAGDRGEPFDAVISALPASALARLVVGSGGERPFASLAEIPHPPVLSLFLGYRREAVGHPLDGFGLLVPAVERRSLLGVIFASTPFAGRAPEGHVALNVMIGGSLQPELALAPLEQVLPRVESDLRDLLGVTGAPVLVRPTLWPRAIPQYDLGHGRHLDLVAAAERNLPGLVVGGQFRDGIALPHCLLAGLRLAERALAAATR